MAKFNIKDFKGVIPAMVTPFDENENVDVSGIRELVNFLIESDIDGLYLTGSTGEGFLMSQEERKLVVEVVVKEVAGRVPIVVHVGDIGTKLSIDLAKHAEKVGADGISSVPPFYWNFNEEQIIKYYEDIATEVNLPMIIYNVPLANLMGLETIYKLAEIENVKGIKYTALSHHEIMQIKDHLGDDFLVYSGADEMALSGLLNGADGIIGSFYNMIPDLFVDIYSAVRANKIDEAVQLQKNAVRIIMHTLEYPSFYAVMKAVLRWNGVNAGYCRRPFSNLTKSEEDVAQREFIDLIEKYNIKNVSTLESIKNECAE